MTTQRQPRRRDEPPPSAEALLSRAPPSDLEAEKGVLGSILLKPDVTDDVALVVRAEDFHSPAHRKLYETMLAIHNGGKQVDVTLVASRLKKLGEFDVIGGAAFLLEIVECVPTAHNAVHYARVVAEKAQLRAVIAAAAETLHEAYDGGEVDVGAIIAGAESRIFACAERRVADDAHEIGGVLVDALAAVDERTEGRPRGLLTGYHGLDDLTGGMRPGQLIIVAARPGLGKSCFSLCVAENCMANHDSRVLIVSLEMSRLEVAERLLAARGHIPLHHLTNNQMSRSERQTLVETSSAVGEMKLVIDDSSERTVTEIAALCRRMKRRGGLDLVIVDYLTLVRADNERDQREEQVAKIARRMKTLARELNAPVVALAQLNREVAKAADNRPQLHHLRSSGAIEQDADQVWMLHRQDYYATTDAERNETEGKAEVIVAKSRNGRTGTVHLSWERRWGRFENQQPKEFT